jgi:hypothetical protein
MPKYKIHCISNSWCEFFFIKVSKNYTLGVKKLYTLLRLISEMGQSAYLADTFILLKNLYSGCDIL